MVPAARDGRGCVPLLLLPRQRVEPKSSGLSGQGEQGMTDGGQDRCNGSGEQQHIHCCPVRNQFVKRYPVRAERRGTALLKGGRDVEQTGMVYRVRVHARYSFFW